MNPDRSTSFPRSLSYLNIPGQALRVWLFLRSLANAEMKCWPKQTTIMSMLGISQKKSLCRSLKTLQSHGLIRWDQCFDRGKGRQGINVYQILLPELGVIGTNPGVQNDTQVTVSLMTPLKKLLKSESKTKFKRVCTATPAHETFLGGSKEATSTPTAPQATPETPAVCNPPVVPAQLGSSDFEKLLGHWRAVFQEKRKAASPVYPIMKCVLRDVLSSQGLPGAMGAVDMWFEKSFKIGYETFDFKWASSASDACYAPEEFERNMVKIVQDRRFATFKAKHEVMSAAMDSLTIPSMTASAPILPAIGPESRS